MIIITGATGGIGSYLTEQYLKSGEEVIGTYYSSAPTKEYTDRAYMVDITNSKAVDDFVEKIKGRLENVVLINCAGVSYNAVTHKSKVEEWAHVIAVNLNGPFHMIRALLPVMREQSFGRIINLSSVVSQTGIAGTSAYAASKAGLNGMIKSIAVENATKGITINNINLGYFNTGMIHTVPPEMQEQIKSRIPVNAFGDPAQIFATIQYLRQASYLTGTCIDLNGGLL